MQVSHLLQARTQGLVGSGTFFVLTLKCTVGYSAKSYDHLVGKQVDRLRPIARDLHTLHLFTNRLSERTVMGYFL